MHPFKFYSAVRVGIVVTIHLLALVSHAQSYHVLHNFAYGEQYQIGSPSGVVLDASGNLFGVTGAGGIGCDPFGCGVVYELSPHVAGQWSFTPIYEFRGGNDGSFPTGALIRDQGGNLYGTMAGDGNSAIAGVYELSPASGGWNYNVLYTSFAGPGVVMDGAGNLYGQIGPGDYFGLGAIGELSSYSSGWTYTQLYSFTCQPSCANGYDLPDPPIFGSDGSLYGVTTDGGINTPPCYDSFGCGVIFRMASNGTWNYQVLHSFGSYATDGLSPYGGLVTDASGNFYGTTLGGGKYNEGTIFKLAFSHGRWEKTDLFEGPDLLNSGPSGNLVFDQAGNLYGAAGGGYKLCAGFSCGSIFKLTKQARGTWKYSVLHRFTGPDGFGPWGVVVDDRGNVFGTTGGGGTYGGGVAFEVTP